MIRTLIASLALTLPASTGLALASEAPAIKTGAPAPSLVEGALSSSNQALMAKGERIPVMVMLDVAEDFAGIDESSRAQLVAMRNSVLDNAFPEGVMRMDPRVTTRELYDRQTSTLDQPQVYAEFEITPGFAIRANAAEIARLRATPGVGYVIEDSLTPPMLGESLPIIGADDVHNLGVTGTGVSVAILDTGIEVEHPMTASAIVGSACFNTTTADASSFCPGGVDEATDVSGTSAGDSCVEDNVDSVNGVDGCFHGTHVGATAAGRQANTSSQGLITGVARNSGLVAVNVFSRFAAGNDNCDPDTADCVLAFGSDQVAALEWLFTNRAALNLGAVNMSLGGGENTTPCPADGRNTVINQLRNVGIATVIASGNDGFTNAVSTPGCIPAAVTVGATDKSDVIASFSNSDEQVDLLAPGVQILAAFQSEQPGVGQPCAVNNNSTGNSEGFCHWFSNSSGTSMATPHVAGAFALLRSAFPNASVDEIETALVFTGVPITDARNGITKPRIQVDAAYTFLQNGGAVVGDVAITPVESFAASGSLGDPSSFDSKVYTLTNQSGANRNFSITTSDTWLSVSNDSGTVSGNGSTQFTVSVNADNIQSAGSLSGSITVTVNGESQAIPATVSVSGPELNNNAFANALPISGVQATTTGSNVGYDKEAGEPNHGTAGGASAWWRWTAPISGVFSANTQGSDYDTAMGVYTGNSVDNLTQLDGNDDENFGAGITTSLINFSTVAGTTYYIAVDGWAPTGGSASQGNITLNLGPSGAPTNDNFANAEVLSGTNGSVGGQIATATTEAGEPIRGIDNATIWYAFTPSSTTNMRFTLDGTHAPASIGVYTGSTVDALTQVAAAFDTRTDLNSNSDFAPAVEFSAEANQTYFISIGASQTPDLTRLSWSPASNATNLFSAILPYARSVQIGQTATAFVSVFNDGQNTALGCVIEGPAGGFPQGDMIFQTTDPATNALTGSPGTPVDIAPGFTQTFVFGATPNTIINEYEFALTTRCTNAQSPVAAQGVNTFILSASALQPSDLIAIAATVSNDGVARIPGVDGAQVFTVAAINIGNAEDITVELDTDVAATATVCETDNGGNCLATPAGTVSANFAQNETRFFSVFLTGTGATIPFDPANNRIRVLFNGSGDIARGGTNVAVTTE